MTLTRRQFIVTAGLCALARAGGIEHALAKFPPHLGNVPIYLTFDDGVETDLAEGKTGHTLDVLDILDARGVRATFFAHGRNTGLAEGVVLARMLRTGHRVGNHAFQQGGATLADASSPLYLAKLYLDTEIRIREALSPYADALDIYLSPSHPHLFRRPGGGYDNGRGNLFLLPDGGYWELFAVDSYLAPYQTMLPWLEGVYDYSGWHINPLPLWADISAPEDVVWWTIRGPSGVDFYLQPTPEAEHATTTRAALDGIIILLHDPDPRVSAALPMLLDALDERGASYHVLPRPVDQPNRYTVGISRPPELVMLNAVRDIAPIP